MENRPKGGCDIHHRIRQLLSSGAPVNEKLLGLNVQTSAVARLGYASHGQIVVWFALSKL